MRPFVLVSIALFASALTPTSLGESCNGNVTDVAGVAYVDDRGENNIWIYVESNGIPGLQSGGRQSVLGYHDDCGYGSIADTLIY